MDVPTWGEQRLTKVQRRAARDEQERRAWRLRNQGKSFHDIAEQLEITEGIVRGMVARKEAEVKERFAQEVTTLKADHTGKLELMYELAMQSYQRSMEPAEEVTTGMAALNQRTGEVVDLPDKVVRRGQAGSPAILLAAAKLLEDQRKIWGANAPEKIEIDVSDDMAMVSLQKKMQDLASRTVIEEERQVNVTVNVGVNDDTPRDQLKAALDVMRSRVSEDKMKILPASVRAETATSGVDLDIGIEDGFTPE